jgi:hypothetical protein
MQRKSLRHALVRAAFVSLLPAALLGPARLAAQDVGGYQERTKPADDAATLKDLITSLQSEVRGLSAELQQVRAEQRATRSELSDLRRQMAAGILQPSSPARVELANPTLAAANPVAGPAESSSAQSAQPPMASDSNDVLSQLREDLQLANSKINEMSQSKVESGSKYRLRFSGIVLFNLFAGSGMVDNLDFPQFVSPPESPALDSTNAFGGSLRQSQIRVQTFGPDIAGAHTSADLKFDFAGGFPQTPNGSLMGTARLRTGTVRFDWSNTSIVAGQDALFFAPLVPTSLASLAIPALSYSGNLWAWTPQVRVEHRVALSESSRLLLQGGILESLSGDVPEAQYGRASTWGEQSGQPAYAGRVSWSHDLHGQDFTIGAGGYYGRQSWGFGRIVDAWAFTTDLSLPLSKQFELTGEFYRGSALGGLGGGIGQTTLWQGSFQDPATVIHGLDSEGGWAQLKFKPTGKFQINGALGLDNPFAGELREYGGNPIYDNSFLSRNFTPFVNFIYQPRSDIAFSTEYRRLRTDIPGIAAQVANQTTFSVGYLF